MWTAQNITHVFSAVAALSNTNHVLMLSDDDILVRDVHALESSGHAGGLQILVNSALGHAKQGQDCVRELSVGCDTSLSEAVIAESVVYDFLLGCSGTHMIGSFSSGFSVAMLSVLYPWQVSSSPPGVGASKIDGPLVVNLDSMDPAFPSTLGYVGMPNDPVAPH